MWGSTLAGNYAKNGWSALKNGGSVIGDILSASRTAGRNMPGGAAAKGGAALSTIGKFTADAWKGGDTAIKAGMIGAGAGMAGGAAATADFLNPWGLGWGD